jgi:hypothetical protein
MLFGTIVGSLADKQYVCAPSLSDFPPILPIKGMCL